MGAGTGAGKRHRLSPLTRETLPEHALVAFADAEARTVGHRPSREADHSQGLDSARGHGPHADGVMIGGDGLPSRVLARELQELWDDGAEESCRAAVRMRRLAAFWVDLDVDPDRMAADDAEMRVALALRMSPTSAHRHIHDAHLAVHELPGIHARLASGELPVTWMQQVLRGVRDLRPEQRADVDAEISGWDLAWTPEQFRRRLSLLLTRIRSREPVPADRTPAAQRRVEVFPVEEEGMACLRLLGPVPEITSLARRLDASARAVQAAQRRVLEAGGSEARIGTGGAARAGIADAGGALDVPFDDGTVLATGRAMSLARLRFDILARSVLETGAVEIPAERFRINVVVPALTLLGASDAPGALDGTVPIPPAMARSLAGSENVWHRILTDPATGAFLPLPAQRYVPTAAMLEHLRLRNATCAVPGCARPSSWASECDHIEEYGHRDPASGGLTELENLHLLCWQHHQMKTAGRIDPQRIGRSPGHDRRSGSDPGSTHRTTSVQRTTPVQRTTTVERTEAGRGRPGPDHGPGATRWDFDDGSRLTVLDDVDVMTPRTVAELEVHWNRHLALVEEREQRARERDADATADDMADHAVHCAADHPDGWGPPPF